MNNQAPAPPKAVALRTMSAAEIELDRATSEWKALRTMSAAEIEPDRATSEWKALRTMSAAEIELDRATSEWKALTAMLNAERELHKAAAEWMKTLPEVPADGRCRTCHSELGTGDALYIEEGYASWKGYWKVNNDKAKAIWDEFGNMNSQHSRFVECGSCQRRYTAPDSLGWT